MAVSERLAQYIDYKGISLYAFENTIGSSRGAISKAIKERKNLGSQVLENILITYTDLNPSWLITGKGDMIIDDSSVISEPLVAYGKVSGVSVPLYNHDAWAGDHLLDFTSSEYIQEHIKTPFAKSGDVAIHAQGNSMYPAIWPGDIIVLREVSHWRDWISYGKAYVIATNDQLLVKVIRKGKVNPGKYYNIFSINQDYDDFELPIEDVRKLMMVVGIVGSREF